MFGARIHGGSKVEMTTLRYERSLWNKAREKTESIKQTRGDRSSDCCKNDGKKTVVVVVPKVDEKTNSKRLAMRYPYCPPIFVRQWSMPELV